jgi:hypothetical protein
MVPVRSTGNSSRHWLVEPGVAFCARSMRLRSSLTLEAFDRHRERVVIPGNRPMLTALTLFSLDPGDPLRTLSVTETCVELGDTVSDPLSA